MYTDEIVAWIRIVLLTHRVECQVFGFAVFLIVPLVDMSQEDDVGIPFFKLFQQEEGLLTGKGGGELERRGTEHISMTEYKRMTEGTALLMSMQ